jgi:membrane protease subunit HflK
VLQDAEGYRNRVIADAQGEAARFEALLTEYQKAPRVTRDRLYLDAIEEVYSNSSKVLLDAEGSGNLLYLPIDKLIGTGDRSSSGTERNRSADSQLPPSASSATSDSARDRRTRQ